MMIRPDLHAEGAMGHVEMSFHLSRLCDQHPLCMHSVVFTHLHLRTLIQQFLDSPCQLLLCATLEQAHWQPLVILKCTTETEFCGTFHVHHCPH